MLRIHEKPSCLALVTTCIVITYGACADIGMGATASLAESVRAEAWLRDHLQIQPAFSLVLGDRRSHAIPWTTDRTVEQPEEGVSRHTATVTDPDSGLAAIYTAIEYSKLAAVELLLEIENRGTADTEILDGIRTLDTVFRDLAGDCIVHHALGDENSAQSFAPLQTAVNTDRKDPLVIFPSSGRSSEGAMPYFNVAGSDMGIVLAVGWAGRWQAEFSHPEDGLRARCGMHKARFQLYPGERVRLPRVLLLFWNGADPRRGNNLFRQWMLAYSLPKRNGNLVMPPISGSVTRVETDGSYEKPHVEAMAPLAQLGLDTFWSDMDPQQWYPKGFPEGTGTWEVDPVKYPHGLKPVGEAAHAAGLDYLLWFEPERVAHGTRIEELHPEWLTNIENQSLFRLDLPEARAWLTDYIDGPITEADVDWLRWDFNMNPWAFWKNSDPPNRRGITEIRHVEGLYAMWEDLFKRHPGLVVDVCASGGRRLDFETLRYGLPLWHSDMQCAGPSPAADQLQNGALFPWIPLHACGNFDYEPSYTFRSALTPGAILVRTIAYANGDDVNDSACEGAQRSVAILKKLRPYMLGDFYPLLPHDAGEDRWYGYQFHRPDLREGFVLVFRRESSSQSSVEVSLNGLNPSLDYDVAFENTPDKLTLTGAGLRQFLCSIDQAPGSQLVYYRERR